MRTPQERALADVAERSAGPPLDAELRVNLHFHPDRVLESLVREGIYRSQFETGTSGGGLTAHPGGDRWRWESRIFGAAYDNAAPAERPKYGALNFRRRAAGAAVRFGSAYFRLAPDVNRRSTFCYPDSVFEPVDFGVAARMSLVAKAKADHKDLLDDYVEAHVHGPVTLATDVEALVLDPCFRGTEVDRLAAELPCPVEWHHGFRLDVEVLREHADYRGAEVVELGESLARSGFVDARVIGDAARAGRCDAQRLKRLWHCTARFGYPWLSA
ncbi:DUF3626 domain-containing protein [Allokutzneria sp. NRRL B-24872]|uniref:DUF3626 domain-containing protein n=1 Tax=Allokutzneria sp. NRRL B-24872 TaxID=1137961 RepID=UPI000A3B0F3D|nr:DUF3626 domain-containing protein [Allokutzneria sp. NRRL B-24872]